MPYSADPFANAIIEGVCGDLQFVLDNVRPRAALVLLLAGIDIMGNLTRPASQQENTSNDFRRWVRKYMQFQGTTMLVDEWWAARNAVIHTYGIDARLHRQGKTRRILWRFSPNGKVATVRERDIGGQKILEVELCAVVQKFCSGVLQSLEDEFKDSQRRPLIEKRAQKLLLIYDISEDKHQNVKRFLDS